MRVIAVIASLCLSRECLSHDVLLRARDSAMLIQSMDFSFTVNLYPGMVQRFRFQGSMARFDWSMQKATTNGTVVVQTTDAFNGRIHQSLAGDQLAISQQAQTGRYFGPCATPLEECFQWLRVGVGRPEIPWSAFRDPEIWNQLNPEPTTLHETINGVECIGLDFKYSTGVIDRVYFDTIHGYFPVRRETIRQDGEHVAVLQVSELIEIQNEGQSFWFPRQVSYQQVAPDSNRPAVSRDYSIVDDNILINTPIDESVFTLSMNVTAVTNLDTNEILIPDTGQTIEVNQARVAPVSGDEPQPWRLLFVAVNVCIILIITIVFLRRIRN